MKIRIVVVIRERIGPVAPGSYRVLMTGANGPPADDADRRATWPKARP